MKIFRASVFVFVIVISGFSASDALGQGYDGVTLFCASCRDPNVHPSDFGNHAFNVARIPNNGYTYGDLDSVRVVNPAGQFALVDLAFGLVNLTDFIDFISIPLPIPDGNIVITVTDSNANTTTYEVANDIPFPLAVGSGTGPGNNPGGGGALPGGDGEGVDTDSGQGNGGGLNFPGSGATTYQDCYAIVTRDGEGNQIGEAAIVCILTTG